LFNDNVIHLDAYADKVRKFISVCMMTVLTYKTNTEKTIQM